MQHHFPRTDQVHLAASDLVDEEAGGEREGSGGLSIAQHGLGQEQEHELRGIMEWSDRGEMSLLGLKSTGMLSIFCKGMAGI